MSLFHTHRYTAIVVNFYADFKSLEYVVLNTESPNFEFFRLTIQNVTRQTSQHRLI